MKAVVKAKAEPGLWLEEVPVPNVGGDDVMIPVLKSSICGTDVHIYNWNAWAQKAIPVPMIIGHEFVGVVDRVGECLSNSPRCFYTPGRSTSQLYGLFVTTWGAGLLTSSCALTF